MIEWDCIEDAAGGVVPITMAIGLNEGFVQAGLDYPMKEVVRMTKTESGQRCEHPEKLKGKPGECCPEQIKECHGEGEEHPCAEEK